jgi:hypothetical protein
MIKIKFRAQAELGGTLPIKNRWVQPGRRRFLLILNHTRLRAFFVSADQAEFL